MSNPTIKPGGVEFYGGPFSNFAPSTIRLPGFDGVVVSYPTVEHRFQAMKATTMEDHERIRTEPDTWEAKRLGNAVQLRPDWEDVKYDVMLEALRAKFRTWAPYMNDLIATGDRYIFENSPTDAVWGLWDKRTGTWTGQNLLGKALMQVRDEIRKGVS